MHAACRPAFSALYGFPDSAKLSSVQSMPAKVSGTVFRALNSSLFKSRFDAGALVAVVMGLVAVSVSSSTENKQLSELGSVNGTVYKS